MIDKDRQPDQRQLTFPPSCPLAHVESTRWHAGLICSLLARIALAIIMAIGGCRSARHV